MMHVGSLRGLKIVAYWFKDRVLLIPDYLPTAKDLKYLHNQRTILYFTSPLYIYFPVSTTTILHVSSYRKIYIYSS